MADWIPSHAKEVYRGEIFSVFNWDQRLFDGSTAVFEAIRKKNSTDVLAMVGDKFILTEQEQPGRPPFIAFPGGRIEDDQTPLENAKAELREEAGYANDDWREIGAWKIGHKIDYQVHVFVAKDCRKVGEVSPDAGEKTRPILVTFDELVVLISEGKVRGSEVLKSILRNGLTSDAIGHLRELTR